MRGGLRQAVWYPLSHESHSKIWRGNVGQRYKPSDRPPLLLLHRTHQLGVVWKTAVFAGVVVRRQVVVRGRGGVRAPSFSVAIPPLPASLHLVVLVAVVLVHALLVLARLRAAVVVVALRAFLSTPRPCVGPSYLPSLSPLNRVNGDFLNQRS